MRRVLSQTDHAHLASHAVVVRLRVLAHPADEPALVAVVGAEGPLAGDTIL